jgi:Protein of unknown function (DUF3592)
VTTEITLLVISGILLSIGISRWRKGNHLLAKGKKANATVFKNIRDDSGTDGPMFYAVIRFITDKQETITKQRNVGYSTPQKVGTKLKIIYDPENPNDFEVHSTFNLETLPRLLTGLGVFGLIYIVLEFLDVVNYL